MSDYSKKVRTACAETLYEITYIIRQIEESTIHDKQAKEEIAEEVNKLIEKVNYFNDIEIGTK